MGKKADQVTADVMALWEKYNGWIPGSAREELAKALRVDPERLRRNGAWTRFKEHKP